MKKMDSLIVERAQRVHDRIKKKQKPEMSFPLRSLSNVRYDPKKGYLQLKGNKKVRTLTYNTVKTFAQTLRMMSESKKLIELNDFATKRELYYISKNWGEARFDEQSESDAVMEDIEAHFEVNREQLRFNPAEGKSGKVVGNLVFTDTDPRTGRPIKIDCRKMGRGGAALPSMVEHLKFETQAKFVLVIETDGMFERLNWHAYWDKANCILVAMEGVPSRACRRFVRRLAQERKLPVYVFCDGDPYGYTNIYRTFKVGSGNAAHINEYFCVPKARFLGVTPQDILDYKLPTHPLHETDKKRARDALKNDPFFQRHKEWQAALKQLIAMGVRAEQQALAKHGLNYVMTAYLPRKLKQIKKFLP